MLRLFSFLLKSVILPKEISEYERAHLQKTNLVAMWFFWAHVPVFTAIAYLNDTGPIVAAALTTTVAIGPWFAYRFVRNPRTVTLVYGFAAMLMGGMLVHVGQGPVQIEMHFYFFALIAMLAVFGNPMAVLVAAVTVAVHHLALWIFLPSSIFNYDAVWWVVAVHAAFVVLEATAGVYIARSFFDNVIELEKVIQVRTKALDERNRSMRLVLENIDQGLVTLDKEGRILPEYSAKLAAWFGDPTPGQDFVGFISQANAGFGASFEIAFEQCLDGFLPLQVSLAQAPQMLSHNDCHYRVRYIPLTDDDGFSGLLLVLADVTAELAQARRERDQRETINILNRSSIDREGFVEYYREAEDLVASILTESEKDPSEERTSLVARHLHTLKGNSMLFGVNTLAEQCHSIEDTVALGQELPNEEERDDLARAWGAFSVRAKSVLGDNHRNLTISDLQFQALLRAALEERPHKEIVDHLADIKLEPTSRRLSRLAEQASSIAERLNKPDLQIDIEDATLRLDPDHWASFWSAFVHLLRNAIDHGLSESPAGDPNRLKLSTDVVGDELVISIRDNGVGIDWAAVRQKAHAKGLDADSHDDLIAALFSEGFSTASEVTAFSGRGIGLSAVRHELEARSGRVEVKSAPNEGTEFIFRFARSQIFPELEARLGPIEPVLANAQPGLA